MNANFTHAMTRRFTQLEMATAYLKAQDAEIDATDGACNPGELYVRFHKELDALPAPKDESFKRKVWARRIDVPLPFQTIVEHGFSARQDCIPHIFSDKESALVLRGSEAIPITLTFREGHND